MLKSHLLNETDDTDLKEMKLCVGRNGEYFILFSGYMTNVLFPNTIDFDSYMPVKLAHRSLNQPFLSDDLYSLYILKDEEFNVLETKNISNVLLNTIIDEKLSLDKIIEHEHSIIMKIFKTVRPTFLFKSRLLSKLCIKRIYRILLNSNIYKLQVCLGNMTHSNV